jgi:hypothetical protein
VKALVTQPADDEIRARAEAFRGGIQVILPDHRGDGLGAFPTGACMDASDLLGTYLSERGYGTFERVCGERRDPHDATSRQTHAWLERDGLIIDITADQFAEVPALVIAAEGSAWHRGWTETSRQPADFRSAGSPEMHLLEQVYRSAAAHADAG